MIWRSLRLHQKTHDLLASRTDSPFSHLAPIANGGSWSRESLHKEKLFAAPPEDFRTQGDMPVDKYGSNSHETYQDCLTVTLLYWRSLLRTRADTPCEVFRLFA